MNIDGARALLMRFNPGHPVDAVMKMGGNAALYIETIQDLLNKGYAFKAATRRPVPASERVPVSKAIEVYIAAHYEPVDIYPDRLLELESQIIAELLRNPPPAKPSGGFTQADMDAAERRGWNAALDKLNTALNKAVQGARR